MTRVIVIPGTPLGELDTKKPGQGTFKEGNTIYAAIVGILNDTGDYLHITPLSGIYCPASGDVVIGIVREALRNAWMLDINAAYPAFLNIEYVPWRVDSGDTEKYLKKGDAIICTVSNVDESKSIDLSMKCRACRRIEDGVIIHVTPSKVPRIIGKKGSMLDVLKQKTNCWIFVGQNGILWIKGDHDNVTRIIEAIHVIEKESHIVGLTQRITNMLGE